MATVCVFMQDITSFRAPARPMFVHNGLMRMASRVLAIATLIGAALAVSGDASAQPREVSVDGGALLLDYPKGWKAVLSGPTYGPTLRLTPGGEGDFAVLITALVSRRALPDDAAVERDVREHGQRLLPTAIQTELQILSVRGAEARGYIFHVTEKTPEKGPGDFRELHQGTVVVGPLLLSVTVLTHPGDEGTVSAAVKAIAGARYRAAK